MAFFESFRKESLDRAQVEAFSNLANTLIFNTPREFKLSRTTVGDLSNAIQQEFLIQDAAHAEVRGGYIRDMHQSIRTSLVRLQSLSEDVGMSEPQSFSEEVKAVHEEQPPEEEKGAHEKTKTEVFLDATNKYLSDTVPDDSFQYGAWGFTPKLAGRKQENSFWFAKKGKNCFGFAQGLAATYRNLGIPFKMGITADHPFLIVDVEGKKYLASLGGAHEAKGSFEVKDGYTMYVPAEEDDIPYSMMLVWDFDEALVHEQLENFEVLRQLSLGADVYTLPDTRESGIEIAKEYKDVLQATSWRDIQHKITPELSQYFRTHRDAWEEEIELLAVRRQLNTFFKETLECGKEATSFHGHSLSDFKKEFLPIAQKHRTAVVDLIKHGVACPPETPEDVVLFAEAVQKRLAAIPNSEDEGALRESLTKLVLVPFLDEGDLTKK